jgi:flagellar biosynthesis regulator FlbT
MSRVNCNAFLELWACRGDIGFPSCMFQPYCRRKAYLMTLYLVQVIKHRLVWQPVNNSALTFRNCIFPPKCICLFASVNTNNQLTFVIFVECVFHKIETEATLKWCAKLSETVLHGRVWESLKYTYYTECPQRGNGDSGHVFIECDQRGQPSSLWPTKLLIITT